MSKKILEEIQIRLNKKTIHDLRQVGRAVGVFRPAEGKKELVLNNIMQIASGEADPVAPSLRGAPPKSAEYDRQLVADIMRCREICLSGGEDYVESSMLSVACGDGFDELDFVAGGVLEKTDSQWLMSVRGENGFVRFCVLVNEYYVQSFGLREGDFISGQCKRESVNEAAGLAALHSVNGLSPEAVRSRPLFETLTPEFPSKQFTAAVKGEITGRLTDILCPLGAGQRALVCGSHGTGRTEILKKLAFGIKKNSAGVKLAMLLVDARAEEAAEIAKLFPDAVMFISLFGAAAEESRHTATLALEYCKRQAEAGMDAVLVIDDAGRLAYAFNTYGKFAESRLDTVALDRTKKFFASARSLKEGGSLTVLTAVCPDGDAVEQTVYSALSGACDMRVTISKELARMRVFPAFDMLNCYSNGTEAFADARLTEISKYLRAKSFEEVTGLLNNFASDSALIKELKG